ncbi:TPA: hypothetical protein J1X52_004427 [Escherichia coli]|nr:hypothetical protein [Escherichia coli]HBA9985283.1 hypothetical protein [Escherichia coli]
MSTNNSRPVAPCVLSVSAVTPANHKRGKNPVCIVFDYSRTLTQKEFPVGLRSWLMREYGDDTAQLKG